MIVKEYPSQKQLKELFHYKDGYLIWRTSWRAGRKAGHVKKKSYTKYGKRRRTVIIEGEAYLNSRLVYIFYNGTIVNNLFIDYIDRNTLDDRIENLRLVTTQENGYNRGATGYTQRKNRWEATIMKDNKSIYLGLFKTKEEARKAYSEAKKTYYKIKEIV